MADEFDPGKIYQDYLMKTDSLNAIASQDSTKQHLKVDKIKTIKDIAPITSPEISDRLYKTDLWRAVDKDYTGPGAETLKPAGKAGKPLLKDGKEVYIVRANNRHDADYYSSARGENNKKIPLTAEEIYDLIDDKPYYAPGWDTPWGFQQQPNVPFTGHGESYTGGDPQVSSSGPFPMEGHGHYYRTVNGFGRIDTKGGGYADPSGDTSVARAPYYHKQFKRYDQKDADANKANEWGSSAATSPFVLLKGDHNPYLTAYDAYMQDAWEERAEYLEDANKAPWFPYASGRYYEFPEGSQHHPEFLLEKEGDLSNSQMADLQARAHSKGKEALIRHIDGLLKNPKAHKTDMHQLLELLDPIKDPINVPHR